MSALTIKVVVLNKIDLPHVRSKQEELETMIKAELDHTRFMSIRYEVFVPWCLLEVLYPYCACGGTSFDRLILSPREKVAIDVCHGGWRGDPPAASLFYVCLAVERSCWSSSSRGRLSLRGGHLTFSYGAGVVV